MKSANSGCGSNGFDFSSGWYCTPTNHGWPGSSMISGRMPSGDMPENTHASRLQAGPKIDVDFVAVAMALLDHAGAVVDRTHQAVLAQHGRIGAKAHRAALRSVSDRRSIWLPRAHSVSSPTTGVSQGPNSVEDASGSPARLRAASITAICMPKQMPKNGTCCSRAKRTAAILPGVPRSPKPPGTRIPWTPSRRWMVSAFRRSRCPPSPDAP